jgi:hypothetical protein
MPVKTLVYPTIEARNIEKKTFLLHLISQLLTGVSLGILLLQDVILKKSLAASDLQVTVLIFMTSSSFLFSIYGVEIINRSVNRQRAITILGVVSKVFLIAIPLFESAGYFIFCIAVMSYVEALLKPAWSTVYKHNYTDQNRSKYYSYASSLSVVVLLLVSIVIGYALDVNYALYKIFFPAAGVVDIIVYYNLSRMVKLSSVEQNIPKDNFGAGISRRLLKDILVLPVRNLKRIFRENKNFRRFEEFFFIYGVANMIGSTLLPIYLVSDLKLSYTPISLAKGMIFHSALILLTPVMGRIHGIGNPMKFCGRLFFVLMCFPLLMLATKYLAGSVISGQSLLYISFFVFGVGMSGVTISWNLSSLYYAPASEVSNYQAVHITLTGVRGLVSPVIGYIVLTVFSIEIAFGVSAVLYGVAGVMMLKEYRKRK